MDYHKLQQIENLQNEQSNLSQIQVTQLSSILQESRKFTIHFIDELKEKALTPISQDVLDYYNGKIQGNYEAKDIIHMIDKRISKQFSILDKDDPQQEDKKNWNLEDIILLLWFVSKYIELKQNLTCQTFSNQDWQYISKLISGSSPKGCMFKFISLKKIKLSIFNWSEKQETLLKTLVEKFGQKKWKQISQILYYNQPTITKIFRTPKQCREHWNCYMDPKLKKGPWSQSEDVKLLQNVQQNKGERKWSSIKHIFEGRTQNALKNRYNLLLQRQKKLTPLKNQTELIGQYLKSKSPTQTQTSINYCSLQSLHFYEPVQSQKKQQQKQKQQIFQLLHQQYQLKNNIQQQNHCQIAKTNPMQIIKNTKILIKSQRSSFKLSQAFQKKFGLNNNLSEMIKQKSSSITDGQLNNFSNSRFVFMVFHLFKNLQNLNSLGAIFTNQQEFYTDVMYKQGSQKQLAHFYSK